MGSCQETPRASTCARAARAQAPFAFPLRPQDALQAELVDRGMLEVKTSADSDRPFIVISAEGYSYVDRIEEEDRRERRLERRDWLIVLVSGLFGMLCTLIGLLIGLSM